MKKLTLSILCLSLCAAFALTSCNQNKPTTDTDAEKTENTELSELSSIVLPTEEEEEIELFEYDYSSDGATLTAYNGDLEEVVLDETVIRMKKEKQKKTVTEEITNEDGTKTTVEKEIEETVEVPVEYTLVAIDGGVFMNNEAAKKIVIPDTVTEIGEACFQGCVALEEVVLPSGLTVIGDRMFYGCDALASLNIPEGVTEIGMFAFGEYFKQIPWYNAQTEASVIVGDGVLLKYNGGASNVSYGDEVKSVAYYAFTDTPVQHVTFGEATQTISELAFYRASVTVALPEGSPLVSQLKLNNVKVEEFVVELAAPAPEANTEADVEADAEADAEKTEAAE